MGHEKRRDGDRDDVVERERPAREEGRDLVERVARERGCAAGFGEHGRALGIRLGREHEQTTGEQEHQRRDAQRIHRHQPERVVDRGAHVAVGGRKHARDADRTAQAVLGQTCHRAPTGRSLGQPVPVLNCGASRANARAALLTRSRLGRPSSSSHQERAAKRSDFTKIAAGPTR